MMRLYRHDNHVVQKHETNFQVRNYEHLHSLSHIFRSGIDSPSLLQGKLIFFSSNK